VILVDTAIWIDHIRVADPILRKLLSEERVLAHAAVIVELALGNLRHREMILAELLDMRPATIATDHEVLQLIDAYSLEGRGIGTVDVHLLASARIDGSSLWTRDKRLHAAAELLGVASVL